MTGRPRYDPSLPTLNSREGYGLGCYLDCGRDCRAGRRDGDDVGVNGSVEVGVACVTRGCHGNSPWSAGGCLRGSNVNAFRAFLTFGHRDCWQL